MNKYDSTKRGVLISRYDKDIQYAARTFLETNRELERVDLLTAEDPLHLFFHHVDTQAMKHLCGHIDSFLAEADPRELILAGGSRPDILTNEEVKMKLRNAAIYLARRFPDTNVIALFVDKKTREVKRVS